MVTIKNQKWQWTRTALRTALLVLRIDCFVPVIAPKVKDQEGSEL